MADKHITAVGISRDMALILRKHFPMVYKDVDITEGFERPCMTCEVGTIVSGAYNEQLQIDRIPLTIYYFSKSRDKGYLDLLQTQEKLRQLLDSPLRLAGSFLYSIEALEFNIVKSDGSLIAEVEYELRQEREITDEWEPMHPDIPLNEEFMEELDINFVEE